MRLLQVVFLLALAVGLTGCASKFRTYNGPEVTKVYVMKSHRKMYLMHHNVVLEAYDIDLGWSPTGDKLVEGDGKTPEGRYYIDRRNPNSSFHLSIGISYPNERDIEEAKALNMSPGGDIFIHGGHPRLKRPPKDWTWGCISVSDREMEDIYAMVKDGTPIDIYP